MAAGRDAVNRNTDNSGRGRHFDAFARPFLSGSSGTVFASIHGGMMPKASVTRTLAPSPVPTLARLSRTVATRIPATLDDPELVGSLRALGAAWLLADTARLKPDAAGRFRLEDNASRSLTRVARTVGRMVDERLSHGPKATRLAARVLRDLRSGQLDMERLIGRAARFRILRRDYLGTETPVPAETIALYDGAFRASRVTSPTALEQLGQEIGGTLADHDVYRYQAKRLRRGSVATWRIDPVDAPWMDDDRPIWVVVVSSRSGVVEEAEHAGTALTIPVDGDVLLEFLASRERRGKGWVHTTALAPHAISPALVEAARAGTLNRFDARLAHTTWRFETAPGLLTAIALDDEATLAGEAVSAVTLTGPSLGADTTYSILSGWRGSNEEDCETPIEGGTVVYARELAFRLALRAACRESTVLRAACADAFRDEVLAFRLDWFGVTVV